MDETRQHWWDLIPKLPTWILSGITFVAAVVGFVKLLDEDPDLVSNVVLVIAATGAWLASAYLAFKHRSTEGNAGTPGSRTRRILGLTGLVLVPLLVLGGFGFTHIRHRTAPEVVHGAEPKDADGFVDSGLTYMKKNDLARARADFDEAIRLEPANVPAHKYRGMVRRSQRDIDGALADYNEALRLDPETTDSSLYVNRGIAWEDKGHDTDALRDYDQAIQIDPRDAWAYKHRGRVRERLGDQDGALEDYTQAITFNPSGDSDEYVVRGLLLQKRKDLDGALRDLTKAVSVDPEAPEPHRKLAGFYEDVGDVAQAIAHYEEFLKLNTDQAMETKVRTHVSDLRAKQQH